MNTKLFQTDMPCFTNTNTVQIQYEYNTIIDQSVLQCTYNTNRMWIQYERTEKPFKYSANTIQLQNKIQCKYNTFPDGGVLRCKSPSQLPSNKAQLNPFLCLSLFCLIPLSESLALLCKCFSVVLFHPCYVVLLLFWPFGTFSKIHPCYYIWHLKYIWIYKAHLMWFTIYMWIYMAHENYTMQCISMRSRFNWLQRLPASFQCLGLLSTSVNNLHNLTLEISVFWNAIFCLQLRLPWCTSGPKRSPFPISMPGPKKMYLRTGRTGQTGQTRTPF